MKKCKVHHRQSELGIDGRDDLWYTLRDPTGGLVIIRTLPTLAVVVGTVLRACQTVPTTFPQCSTSNTNSTGAFGIMRWPKMRKSPYKTKFFAFLVFFLNSGFYMIVRSE